MKTIKTNNAELLIVKVPRDTDYNYLPSIGYQIKNTLSKLTEEQAKELVEDSDYHAKCYKKYDTLKSQNETKEFLTVIISCLTALESFHSLMAVNGVYLTDSEYLILIKK